jgi:hypothetical protein
MLMCFGEATNNERESIIHESTDTHFLSTFFRSFPRFVISIQGCMTNFQRSGQLPVLIGDLDRNSLFRAFAENFQNQLRVHAVILKIRSQA